MTVRQKTCPECGSTKITVLERRPGQSLLPNDAATLQCDDCSHKWEGSATNPDKMAKMRRQGVRI